MMNTDNAILAMLMEQEELNVIKTKISLVEKTIDNKQDSFHEGDDEPDPNVQGKFWMRNLEGRRKLHYWNSDTNQWELMTPTSPDDIGAIGSEQAAELADRRIGARVGTQLVENDWTIGSGATDFFDLIGNDTENYRVYGINPKGQRSVLWECRPDAVNDADGGWITKSFVIDKSKTYRFSVFVKTNNNSGRTYFGCTPDTVATLNTDTKNPSPYFWDGDLPQNDKWYLIVGYIFPTGQIGLDNLGGVYECETGKKITDVEHSFNWAADCISSSHKCSHYFNINIETRQWMFNPRVDLIDGNEPSVIALLGKVDELGGVLSEYVYHTDNRPNMDDIPDGITYHRIKGSEKTNLADGKKLDGSKYSVTDVEGAESTTGAQAKIDARLSSTEKSNLNDGKKPSGSSITLDQITNGSLYKRVKSGAVTESGEIDVNSTYVINKLFTPTEKNNLNVGKNPNGSLIYFHPTNKPNVEDVEGAISSAEASSLADDRISTKIGSDTVIGYLKAGKKEDGTYIQATDIGAETPSGSQAKIDARLSSTEKSNLNDGKKPSGSSITLDQIANGSTYKRVRYGAVTESGQIDVNSTYVINKLFTPTEKNNLNVGKNPNGSLVYFHPTNKPTVDDLPTIPITKVEDLSTRLDVMDDEVILLKDKLLPPLAE